MKIRFIKVGQRDRVMVRTNSCEELIAAKNHIFKRGFAKVGLVKFWMHVIFWWRKAKKKP